MTFSKFNSDQIKNKKIILFDIDGTLLRTGGVGQASMERAFFEVYGRKINLKRGNFAGKTDHIIYFTIIEKYSLKPKLGEFKRKYFKNLEELLSKKSSLNSLPGVMKLCETLSRKSDFYISLLTGNWRNGAFLKVKYYGLKKFFKNGIFGDGVKDRNTLGKKAKEMFKESKKIFIIGDTPSDIECAKTNGLKVIAVSTGPYSMEKLSKFNPDLLLKDLTEIEKLLHFLERDN